jgi:hypothetical protein
MMEIDLFSTFKNDALEKGIIFYYSGRISQNVIATMSDVLKQRFENAERPSNTRKVFSSFIEMIQNALHYSPLVLDSHSEKIGAIAVGKNAEHYYIVCGNLVDRQYIPRISEKIDLVNSMTKEEIKAAYKEQLKNDGHADDTVSKGAGLGLLTMARDATSPIEYKFKPVTEFNNQYSELHLKTLF